MHAPRTRREFLANVGQGMVVAAVGLDVARDLGLAQCLADDAGDVLTFGPLEPLVCLMQETAVNQLVPVLMDRLRSGTDLRQLVAAGALANARTFGGEDYVGFHTMMALAPAFHMAQELPLEEQPLPVLKVLYRNTNRIQEQGGRKHEVLRQVKAEAVAPGGPGGAALRAAVRQKDMNTAERTFASVARSSAEEAFDQLLMAVQDATEVHRVVLPYRAWDLLSIIGREQAHTLLRQSVRYCVKAESWQQHVATGDYPRVLLPSLMDEYQLLGKSLGNRTAEDSWVDQLCCTIFKSTPVEAARAAASALAEGMAPAAVGEGITLAANQLILRDMGRTPRDEVQGKPVGSVHGDSIGVHACDSANAWRNMAFAGCARNCYASLILGAYQVALDRTSRGGDFLNWSPLPVPRHLDEVKAVEPGRLLREADEAIRANLQAKASAVIHRYGELGHPPRPVFDLLLRYAVSEDGSLHAEKFYRTVSEEFASTRPAFRWRHLVALARVTASEFGHPAKGIEETRALLHG